MGGHPGALGEQEEQVELAGGEVDRLSGHGNGSGVAIDPQLAHYQLAGHRRTADQLLGASQAARIGRAARSTRTAW